jgi:hypothetical protein
MKAAAVHTLAPDASVELATVVSRDQRALRVSTADRELRAEVAQSCLLAPNPGDRVLVVHAGEEAYVLSVLKRGQGGETAIELGDDVTLHVSDGRLRVLAEQAIELKTRRMRFLAEAFDTIAGRIYQRAVNFLRRTDELDRVEAKNIDRKAEQLLHHHAENAVTTAEKLVKIDGSQVHVG